MPANNWEILVSRILTKSLKSFITRHTSTSLMKEVAWVYLSSNIRQNDILIKFVSYYLKILSNQIYTCKATKIYFPNFNDMLPYKMGKTDRNKNNLKAYLVQIWYLWSVQNICADVFHYYHSKTLLWFAMKHP